MMERKLEGLAYMILGVYLLLLAFILRYEELYMFGAITVLFASISLLTGIYYFKTKKGKQ